MRRHVPQPLRHAKQHTCRTYSPFCLWNVFSWRFNAELNPICLLLALLGARHIFHVSGLRCKIHKSYFIFTRAIEDLNIQAYQRAHPYEYIFVTGVLQSMGAKTGPRVTGFFTKQKCLMWRTRPSVRPSENDLYSSSCSYPPAIITISDKHQKIHSFNLKSLLN